MFCPAFSPIANAFWLPLQFSPYPLRSSCALFFFSFSALRHCRLLPQTLTGNKITNVSGIITNFHLYNPRSKPNDWSARINGSLVFSNSNNTVAFPAAPALGYGQNYFEGDMLELLIFDQDLMDNERTTVNEYLRRKYNLW
jgi:hypothetical protein